MTDCPYCGKAVESLKTHKSQFHSALEDYAAEDGMYANFGKKDKNDSWSVLSVAGDLIYFNTEQEARDYTRNWPKDNYTISPPRSGVSESARYASESPYPQPWSSYERSELGSAAKHFDETKWYSHDDLLEYDAKCNICGKWVNSPDRIRPEYFINHVKEHNVGEASTSRYSNESIKEDVYNFIKIQSGGVPAYSRMMSELGYNQADIIKAVDELKQEGRISSSFGDRTSHHYPESKNPFQKGTTDADFGGSGEWYWNAENNATELDHYEPKEQQSQREWDEDLEQMRKELTRESYDGRGYLDKVEIFESFGFSADESMKLATLEYHQLSTEMQKAIAEVDAEKKDEKRDDSIDAFNAESPSPDSKIKEPDEIDYNIIGENTLARSKYECEHCNSGFKSNESLMIHYNDVHAVSNEFFLDGYEAHPFSLKKKNTEIANEFGEWWRKYVTYETGYDQDFMYCTKCGYELLTPAYNTYGNLGDEAKSKTVISHLKSHGVTESFLDAGEATFEKIYSTDEDPEIQKLNPEHRCGMCGKTFDSDKELKEHAYGLGPHNRTTVGESITATEDHWEEIEKEEGKMDSRQRLDWIDRRLKQLHDQGKKDSVKEYDATETVSYAAEDGEFREEDHPRADDGKFTSKGSGGSSGGTKQVEKPKPSKYFNKAKDRALKIIGEPKDEYDRKKYNAVKNLDGYPTHSSQLRGIGAGAKAAIMKAHLTDTYGGIFGARKDGYREVVPMWKGGSAYPYGAGQLVKVYSDHGASNMMVDYSDTDTYVFGVRDERPDRPKWDGSNVADTREQRFAEWIASWAYSKENPAGSSINPKKLGWNDWNNLAKWTLEGKSSGFSDSSRDLNVKFSDLDDIKRQFLEQEQKEGGAQPAQDVPKATTPAFHTQQYMGEDPDKPDQIPIDPETGEELPVSKYNPLEHKYKPSDPTKATKKDVVRAYGDLKGNKARADKLEDIAPADDPTYGAEPWQKGGESLDDVYAEITNTATESIANEVEWMCMDCEKKLTETPREHQDKTGHHSISKFKAGRDEEFINEGFVDNIRHGDKVTIVDKRGQTHTGKAVMKSSTGGWIINTGGAHGTPALADDENIVAVEAVAEEYEYGDDWCANCGYKFKDRHEECPNCTKKSNEDYWDGDDDLVNDEEEKANHGYTDEEWEKVKNGESFCKVCNGEHNEIDHNVELEKLNVNKEKSHLWKGDEAYYGYGSATGRMSPVEAWNQGADAYGEWGYDSKLVNPVFDEFRRLKWSELPHDIQELWKAQLNYRPSEEAEFDKNWGCPRCGERAGIKIKYDDSGNPVGRECPKCGLGKESMAEERGHEFSYTKDDNSGKFCGCGYVAMDDEDMKNHVKEVHDDWSGTGD